MDSSIINSCLSWDQSSDLHELCAYKDVIKLVFSFRKSVILTSFLLLCRLEDVGSYKVIVVDVFPHCLELFGLVFIIWNPTCAVCCVHIDINYQELNKNFASIKLEKLKKHGKNCNRKVIIIEDYLGDGSTSPFVPTI